MRVLVACEESQAVTKELRSRGHEAFSCDLLECSGGRPDWHIQGDVLPLLNGRCRFNTADGVTHIQAEKWDMLLAFPPCTYLTVTGNRWFNEEKYGDKARQRKVLRTEAINFFMQFVRADCDKIAIENPVGVMSSEYRKPDQIVHPYYFAKSQDDENCERKGTCLWLKGLEPLTYDIKFEPRVIAYKNGKGTDSPWHMSTMKLPPAERARARSKTFPGIAEAMARQWTTDRGESMNNYEKIKMMSMEELADFLDCAQADALYGSGSTPEEWMDWLRAEAL